MAPLVVLVAVSVSLFVAGVAGLHGLRSWPVALGGGLAAMFILTGVSHFTGMREDLVRMVPPFMPEPGLLVSVTGALELAGAAGLLLPRTAPWAAGALGALLVLMFPANVYAAMEGLNVGGAPAMALIPRALLQLIFLSATLAVLLHYLRGTQSGALTDDPAAGPPESPQPSSKR
ncbi:DoxX family protein [Arthrobacter sp. SX1312]|uniref:DoxX family protein n=1 Tax=Arthrobacter sp. SX1312 TaxID=2058896 RepID=UPI000CE4348B|nr:DoxX family protein [Arthrobacter sp. SX1312]